MSTSWHWSPKQVIAFEEPGELMEQLDQPIMSQASQEEGASTIPQGSRTKRFEAPGPTVVVGDDIVSSAWEHAAVYEDGISLAN